MTYCKPKTTLSLSTYQYALLMALDKTEIELDLEKLAAEVKLPQIFVKRQMFAMMGSKLIVFKREPKEGGREGNDRIYVINPAYKPKKVGSSRLDLGNNADFFVVFRLGPTSTFLHRKKSRRCLKRPEPKSRRREVSLIRLLWFGESGYTACLHRPRLTSLPPRQTHEI